MAISWPLAVAIFVIFVIGYVLGYTSGHSRGRLDVLEEEHLEADR